MPQHTHGPIGRGGVCSHHSGQANAREGPAASPLNLCTASPSRRPRTPVARLDAGLGEFLNGNDLYPDARPTLQVMKDAGYFVGIASNQTGCAGLRIRALADWGAEKPSPGVLHRDGQRQRHHPRHPHRHGDRMDNDIHPAATASTPSGSAPRTLALYHSHPRPRQRRAGVTRSTAPRG